jgi:hypothetical protein
MSAIRTNPAYASLAYRRTIIHQTITYLKREYVGVDEDPKQKLICEEVLAADAEVPIEEVATYLQELEREKHELTLELGKFEFTRRDDESTKQRAKKKTRRQGR